MKISTIIGRLRKIRRDLSKDVPGLCKREKKDLCSRDHQDCIYCVKSEAWCSIGHLIDNINGKRVTSGKVLHQRAMKHVRKMIQEQGKGGSRCR